MKWIPSRGPLTKWALAAVGVGAGSVVALVLLLARPSRVPVLPGVVLAPDPRAAPTRASLAVDAAVRIAHPTRGMFVHARLYLLRATAFVVPGQIGPPGLVQGGELVFPEAAYRADPQLEQVLSHSDAPLDVTPTMPPVWVVFIGRRHGFHGRVATVVVVDARTDIALVTLANVSLAFVPAPSAAVSDVTHT